MSNRDLYAVRISGLVEGDHGFLFELDQKFFASLEQSEIEKGHVKAEVILEKKTGVFSLHFNLFGEVEVICDRCLEPFMAEVDTKQTIFVKMGEEVVEIDDDVIMIHRDDHEIEVGQYMYEFILLALPYQRIHPDDDEGITGCDPEMMQRLAELQSGEEKSDETDPRWDTLKGIIE